MAVEYKTVYRVEFCEQKNFQSVVVLLKRRMDSSSPTPTVIEVQPVGVDDNPVVIKYADTGVYKMNQINGSECELNLVSSADFDLKSLYTADETEWLAEISGAWTWTGYVIPDSCSEPFLQHPYPVTITAVDRLGILKDIPYINKTILYKGFETDLTIISRVLALTDIKLDIVSAINTTEQTMNANDPLTQVYIDNDRFHDIDGNPFTCEVVLKSILDRWGAQLHQFNGAWQIVNVLEKSRGIVPARKFNYLGVFISNTTIGNDIQGGGEGRTIRPVGSTEIAKALASSTAYYQYGYPSNKLFNGDFNIWSPPMALPEGWSSSNGAVGSVGSVADNPDDKYLIVINTQPASSAIVSDFPVQIRSTDSVSISFDLYAPTAVSGGIGGSTFIRVLIQDQFGNYFTNTGWARGGFYEIKTPNTDFINQMSIRFDVNDRPEDYQLRIGFRTVISNGSGVERETNINNVEIRVSLQSNQTKPPLGSYNRQRSLTSQTATKDPILILHSDEANRQRTSRLLINNLDPDPYSLKWKRAGYTENISLLQTIANTELTLHQRPYEIFEADFFGYGTIGLNSRLSVDLIPDVMIFLSGSFNIMSGVHSLRFAQILIDKLDNTNVAGFDQMFEDYGGLTDKSGLSVGSPSSVSPGGGGATIDTNGFIKNQTEYQTDAKYNVSVGIVKDKLIIPSVVPGGLIAGQVAIWASNLSGISNNPSGYVLPVASASILGGVKIGAGLTMTGEVLSASGGESPLTFTFPLVRTLNNVAIDPNSYVKPDGTNATGTWAINISGSSARSATSALADNSTLWNGYQNSFADAISGSTIDAIAGQYNDGKFYRFNATALRNFIGSPSGGETLGSVTARSGFTTDAVTLGQNSVIPGVALTVRSTPVNGTNLALVNRNGTARYDFFVDNAVVDDGYLGLFDRINNRAILSVSPTTGNLGIGHTTDQWHKLAVNGSLISTTAEATDIQFIPVQAPSSLPSGKTAVWASNLSGISNNPSGYILPIATSAILGGIIVGSGLTINPLTGRLDATGAESPLNFLSPLIRTGNTVSIDLTAYAKTDGSNAYGNWSININGSATSVPWAGITGRPTNLSQFTNDLGNYGNWITKAQGDGYYTPINSETLGSVTARSGFTTSPVSFGRSSLVSGSILSVQSTSENGINITMINRNQTQRYDFGVDVNAVDDGILGIYDRTGSAYRFIINKNGNIVVGYTSDQGYKLAVNGAGLFATSIQSPIVKATVKLSIPTASTTVDSGEAVLWIGNLSGITN